MILCHRNYWLLHCLRSVFPPVKTAPVLVGVSFYCLLFWSIEFALSFEDAKRLEEREVGRETEC